MSYNIPIQYVQQSPSPQPSQQSIYAPNANYLPLRNNIYMSNQDKNNNTTYTIPVNLSLSNNSTNSINKTNLINTTTSNNNNNSDIDNLNTINNYNINLTGNLLNKQQYDLKQQQMSNFNNNFNKGLINNNTDLEDEVDEVDLIKDLLMKNLNSSSDPNFYGICMKCSEKIYGADNGLRAMDQLFHVKCFVCHGCNYSLQGQHFYAMDNKSFCENCYMRLLERCSLCTKPITDRVISKSKILIKKFYLFNLH